LTDAIENNEKSFYKKNLIFFEN